MPTSTPATRLSKRIVKQLSWEAHHLLPSVAEYTKHIGKRTNISRQLRTLIEFYVEANDIGKAVKLYIGNAS